MPPRRHEFTDENVDAAIEFVVKNGAEDRGQTIAYSRVFDAAGSLNLKTCTSAASPRW
jgi:hypothetical protein